MSNIEHQKPNGEWVDCNDAIGKCKLPKRQKQRGGKVSKFGTPLTKKPPVANRVVEGREEFSKSRGDFILVNSDDGYILSDDCVVIEGDEITADIYENPDEFNELVENNSTPIQAISEYKKYKNPLVVEPDSGAITSLNGLYAIKASNPSIPDGLYDNENETKDWTEKNGLPLFD